MPRASRPLSGRRVLVTGAARGIGAALAERLAGRGARPALAGLEPDVLRETARRCGDAPWFECDVTDRAAVEAAVDGAVGALGGLDVVVANAGVAAQLPLVGGDPEIFETTIAVNLVGVYYTVRAAAPHVSHPDGYALLISSLAAAVHAPLLGAYNASKAGVEALGNTLRTELSSSGARVGVAYFSEIDTDMTRRGTDTDAARAAFSKSPNLRIAPLPVAVGALERGIARRDRRIVAPGWVAAVLPVRMMAQALLDRGARGRLDEALRIARSEHAPLTTAQPRTPAE